MGTAFAIDHSELGDRYSRLAAKLDEQTVIDSTQSFNRYCRNACRFWLEEFPDKIGATTKEFQDLQEQIETGGDSTIKTGWGGVVITFHEHPRVEKFLVVNRAGYLALEKHDRKDEHLDVREGAGLALWRASSQGPLVAEALVPGKSLHLEPGMEHCLIGCEDLLVFERSIDPKGMDRDLIFIFEPET
jgi:hypothetical protein